MKKNNFINKWLDENQDPKIEAKVKAEAEQKYKSMKTQEKIINKDYRVGDVCIRTDNDIKEDEPKVFTTHKVDMARGVVYYYKLNGVEESIGTSYIETFNTKECTFYPTMNTTSATICSACGREKFEHNL